jgi:hypothetical protein
MNFFLAERPIRSSFSPMTNMTIIPANMYFNSLILYPFEDIIIPMMKPTSNAIPPRVGTIFLAADRWLGTSNNFLMCDTLMILGIIKKAMVKLIAKLKNRSIFKSINEVLIVQK